ncbi:hypothetical protein AMAG_09921 [Allomyces macrogynus ATCC 38327]|uniref:F5/8 type C domain-containing protein n=1 Tax=Allomyces macrogynus (strain ATCC 38327) TaxID=578462 RepID=A0A0L0SPZ8_ALLM3|nr:hypothetical protein AMAG_09921 [Allomyces macrogynus ATCC 38327]|eukprot:KNE64562.1 hypothetical protein AMAG_09921 [Allomyces macrogynus ATCC 38327]
MCPQIAIIACSTMTSLLSDARVQIKVSSVLNRDTAQFGKQHLTDGDAQTCWNSDAGKPQRIVVDFGRAVHVHSLTLTFQGGFVGHPCHITPDWTVYPGDTNAPQTFTATDAVKSVPRTRMQLMFADSTDFYGRVTLFQLDVVGIEAAA